MRDLVRPVSVAGMSRLSLSVVVALTGCTSPAYEAFQAGQDKYASTGAGETTSSATPTGTSGDMQGGTASEGSAATGDAASGDASGSSDTGALSATGDPDSTAGYDTDLADPPDIDKPSIVSVQLPAKVYAAGPVSLEILTEHTASVQIELDGVDLGELADAGEGKFVGALPVRGAIDNGDHTVTITAHHGPFQVSENAGYGVSTPKPGTMAWFKAGLAGSRTNRIALTAEGDVLEAGQVEINKITRPSLRKRSGLTGAELWSVTLDTREGSTADLAVLPDGRVWVAMNVRKPGDPSPQPRIALFDAAGQFTGVEAFGDLGQGVRGIAADAEGGCFAVGFASAGKDLDVGFWRVNAAGVQTLGHHWDYDPNEKPHTFSDLAMDVVIEGDIAWVVGASSGKHNIVDTHTRGMLVPMNLYTGEVKDPVIIAAKSGASSQSVFFGAGHHPLGVLVTGYACDDTCTNYQIATSLYGPTGKLLWSSSDAAGIELRYGSDVVLDSQGRALVAGAVTEKGLLRGYFFAHRVGGEEVLPLLEHWFPISGPSEALGVLSDAYDRLFSAGYITANGSTQARLVLVHG